MNLAIIPILFTLAFNYSNAMDASIGSDTKIHGVILKAQLPDKQEITFVPTHHFSPFQIFSLPYQKEITKHAALIIECHETYYINPSETEIDKTLLPLIKYGSRSFLKEINGLSSGFKWSFKELGLDENGIEEIKSRIENTFKRVADVIKESTEEDFFHFYDIYQMKPGVVFALYWEIFLANQESDIRYMDDEITNIFKAKKKPVVSVESRK